MVAQVHLATVFAETNSATRRNGAHFYDDMHSGVPDGKRADLNFVDLCKDFFGVMRKHKVLLKPPKVKLGYSSGTFYGFDIGDDGGNGLTDEFLAPLNNWASPTDIKELRSLMGTLSVGRDYVSHFAAMVAPLRALLKKGVEFKWTKDCQEAVESVVKILKSGIKRYAPDFRFPLHLSTDASDDGAGGHCWQDVPDGKGGTVRRTIGFFSASWTPELRRRPVFYREAWACLRFLRKIRILAMSSKFPVFVHTDHVSLKWVQFSHKGSVTSFLLDELGEIRFVMIYNKGTSLIIAVPDSMSRYPMLGERRWSWTGLEGFYRLLFKAVAPWVTTCETMWLYAGTDTRKLAVLVREDMQGTTLVTRSPTSAEFPKTQFSILATVADKAPALCSRVLLQGLTAAVLMPTTSDLHWTSGDA